MKNKAYVHGKVYIIGAGPGDPELITLKAKKYIQIADVIVYDRLINDNILMFSNQEAELIYVGKKTNFHTVSQSEINTILVNKALEGKIVARIKGGDPFVFGRGGEEIEELVKYNIDYEVIPGITSAIAVPAYAGIPVTHRNYVSSFHVITGHKKDENSLQYKQFSNVDGTLIFVMAVNNINIIIQQLIESGKSKNTPVAIIQNGTTTEQFEVIGTLENICELARINSIEPPAIMIIGEVVNLSKKLRWRNHKILSGKKILITRPYEHSNDLAEKLIDKGAEVFQCPIIKIAPIEEYKYIDYEIYNIERYQWLVFTSVNGVEKFFERIKYLKFDIRNIKASIAVIGEKTKKAVENIGINVKYMPEKYTGMNLAEGLKDIINNGDNILLPRADISDKNIINILENAGGICTDLTIYKIIKDEKYKTKLIDIINNTKLDYLVFTSSSTVKNFIDIIGLDNIYKVLNIVTICIGSVTADKAKDYGFKKVIIPEKYTIDSLVDRIVKYCI